MKNITCGFIGLGLIGGSIARALRAASDLKSNNCNITLMAYDPDVASLDMALKEGILDSKLVPFDQRLCNCDFIFLCAPVSHNSDNLHKLKELLYGEKECDYKAIQGDITKEKEGSPASKALAGKAGHYPIITDVGSVKSPIHKVVRELGLCEYFIGGHPMAGSERIGYRNSSALILQNAYYILTPESGVADDSILAYRDLVNLMGALPLIVEPSEHDRVTAAISHLPHIIASALVNLVRNKDSERGLMKQMAAGGFKDITRIASSSPEMWEQICLNNSGNIMEMLEDYIAALKEIGAKISQGQDRDINSFFSEARNYRESFINAPYGPIKKAFDMYINIADEPGAIAQISTTLAVHQVNIKNLGIVHNRELNEGTFRIEFPNDKDLQTAKKLLAAKGYEIVR